MQKMKSAMEMFTRPVYAYVSFILVVLILGLHACMKDNLDVPPALQARIDSGGCDPTCPSFVDKYLWRSQTVYIFSCSGAACNCFVSVYDAQGNELLTSIGSLNPSYTYIDFKQEAELVSHIWRCDR